MKVVEFDITKHHASGEQREIKTGQVAFIESRTRRIIISFDEDHGKISIYKTGYDNEELIIFPSASNKIFIM